MFETNFSYSSSAALPPSIQPNQAIALLHDFETINKLNPDVKGCRPIAQPAQPTKNGILGSKKSTSLTNGATNGATTNGASHSSGAPLGQTQFYEVEDDLPFMPKKLWSGGVKYQADFVPLEQGCDITIHAPGGFTSVNKWRLIQEQNRSNHTIREEDENLADGNITDGIASRGGDVGGNWYVQITSDAKCNKTFAGFVKGFLKNSHAQLQHNYVDRLKGMAQQQQQSQQQQRPGAGYRRPTLGRRRSSQF